MLGKFSNLMSSLWGAMMSQFHSSDDRELDDLISGLLSTGRAPYVRQPGEGHKRNLARLKDKRAANASIPSGEFDCRQRRRYLGRCLFRQERTKAKIMLMKNKIPGGASALRVSPCQ